MPNQFPELAPIKGFYGTTQRNTFGFVSLIPEQVIGLYPCRVLQNSCDPREYPRQCLPVFAEIEGACTRNNDFSAFLFDFASTTGNNFKLQQWDGATWTSIANLTDNTYGQLFGFGAFASYPTRSGFRIDWQSVLQEFGEGHYRFYVADTLLPDASLYSFPFNLRVFSKDSASNTVRIETIFKGEIGNILWQGVGSNLQDRFDLVNMENGWTDQVRHHGYFGNVKPGKEQTFVKYANDSNSLVNSRQTNKYTLQFDHLIDELTDRISTYGMNSYSIKVCNYHVENGEHLTDFAIKQVSEGEPTYYPRAKGGFVWEIECERAYDILFQKGGR